MIARGLALIFLVLLGWLGVPGSASAAISCTVASASNMNFGTLAFPVGAASTTADVTVSCSRTRKNEKDVLVCVGLSNFVPTRYMRRNGGGNDQLAYRIYGDAAYSRPLGFFSYATHTLSFAKNDNMTEHTFTLYGQLDNPQKPEPIAGNYSEQVNAGIRYVEANGNANCFDAFNLAFFDFAATASVQASCKIAVTPLDFGTAFGLDADVASQATMRVACTPQTQYTVRLDGGGSGDVRARRMQHTSSGASIAYNLYHDAAHSELWGDGAAGTELADRGTGTGQTFTVYGLVPAVPETQSPPVGRYTDTVTATVVY